MQSKVTFCKDFRRLPPTSRSKCVHFRGTLAKLVYEEVALVSRKVFRIFFSKKEDTTNVATDGIQPAEKNLTDNFYWFVQNKMKKNRF